MASFAIAPYVNPRLAVITAADWRQQFIALQTMVDREGRTCKVLGHLIDEITSTGIERIGIVIKPGDEPLYRDAVQGVRAEVTFIHQPEARGYGDAVLQARAYTQDEPFLLMVSDHVYVSQRAGQSCAQQLVECARTHQTMVSAVQATHESRLLSFGAIGGTLFDPQHRIYQVQRVLEKPSPTLAEQQLIIPGLRHGYYLCFLGMHVLTPLIHELLSAKSATLSSGEALDLSSSLQAAAERSRYLAAAVSGRRYDLDHRHGVLLAQLAVALDGKHRDELLTSLVDLLAHQRGDTA
jgi:UTP--glucose-1-phosphate uridylyltransferase